MKPTLLSGCALAAVGLFASLPASAQAERPAPAAQAPDGRPEAAAAEEKDEQADQIIVTGSSRSERRFDVSYAVNALDRDAIAKLAPLNYADLLGQLPGIQAEATGGEVQNITRVRGVPSDDGRAVFQQDGIALFHELNGVFFRGDSLIRNDLMTDRIEVVRGGPSPVYVSQAAAIINNISVTGSDTPRGKVQVTLGDTGLYRLDAVQSGPLGGDTYYAVGGYLRRHDGYRDNGFPSDHGGQIRANIKHEFDNGTLMITGNYLNDHSIFYLPIPVADPRNPEVSLDPYIDFFDGTLNGPAFRNVNLKYLDGAGVLQSDQRDLADGRHLQFWNAGLFYDAEFGDWQFSAKATYTKGKVDFDALYSTSNPQDATVFANGFLTRASSAFGTTARPVARLGYAIAGTNGATVYDPSLDSGLVMQAQYRAIQSRFHSGQGDVSLSRLFETEGFGTHAIKLGVYGSAYGETQDFVFQDYLMEVKGKPRTLDLVAYDAGGAVLGYVTDKGVLRYATTLSNGEVDATVLALYANDTWELADGLRLDGGVRYERYDYSGFSLPTAQVDLGDPTTLADDTTRRYTGATQGSQLNVDVFNWTAGINYDLTDSFGVYGRISNSEVPPSALVSTQIDPAIVRTTTRQYEAGIKFSNGQSYLYLTGFYVQFDPLNASFAAFNPQTGRSDQTLTFVGEASVKGVEADGSLRIGDLFALAGSVTYQDPQYASLENDAGADPGAVQGNQIVRQPKIFGNIRPSMAFDLGDASVDLYGRWNFVGLRYVDLFNNTRLPAYDTFSAGVTVTYGDWQVQLVGDNLTNSRGLTEGNPRTDQLTGQGSRNAIYGRPLFGRNFRLVISKEW